MPLMSFSFHFQIIKKQLKINKSENGKCLLENCSKMFRKKTLPTDFFIILHHSVPERTNIFLNARCSHK